MAAAPGVHGTPYIWITGLAAPHFQNEGWAKLMDGSKFKDYRERWFVKLAISVGQSSWAVQAQAGSLGFRLILEGWWRCHQ